MSVEGVQSLHFVAIIVTIQKGLEEEQEEVLDQLLKMTKISQSSPKLSSSLLLASRLLQELLLLLNFHLFRVSTAHCIP